ncbi:hypothetical protein B0J12DRAFT_369103 [Macrophomina phaseolina]|uniref:Uncharacterized protein n=1 Tax=Macrophomina phaseolina TaxID=35725 RepID=A0ABQ8GJP4_9PEZI|nr:hypothetical protein B0J12DRAFT_369103 [Macrophomina phaseolina]
MGSTSFTPTARRISPLVEPSAHARKHILQPRTELAWRVGGPGGRGGRYRNSHEQSRTGGRWRGRGAAYSMHVSRTMGGLTNVHAEAAHGLEPLILRCQPWPSPAEAPWGLNLRWDTKSTSVPLVRPGQLGGPTRRPNSWILMSWWMALKADMGGPVRGLCYARPLLLLLHARYHPATCEDFWRSRTRTQIAMMTVCECRTETWTA